MRALLLFLILASLSACSGEEWGGDKDGWNEERPPGLACEPDVPEGIDPTAGVSFDPGHMLCVQVTMDEDAYAQMADESKGLALAGLVVAFSRRRRSLGASARSMCYE
jgi:MYXO-CTERM domain-containing protein